MVKEDSRPKRSSEVLQTVSSITGRLHGDVIKAADGLYLTDDDLVTFCGCMAKKGKTGDNFCVYFRECQLSSGKGSRYKIDDLIVKTFAEFKL